MRQVVGWSVGAVILCRAQNLKKSSRILATGTRNLVANSQLSVAKLRHQSSNSKELETKVNVSSKSVGPHPSRPCHVQGKKVWNVLFLLFGNSSGTKPYYNLLKLRFSFLIPSNDFRKAREMQRPARQKTGWIRIWIGARKGEFWRG